MKTKLILLLLVFMATDAFSQRNVSGVVVNENNEPIVSALIRELALIRESGTTTSYTTTNPEGEFTFTTTRNNNILRFSSFGYLPQYIGIVSDTVVAVKLERGRIVSGIIFDENNEPAHGASIRIMGTNLGAITDNEGRFRLTTADSTEVQISFFGTLCQTLKITSDTIVTIRLEADRGEVFPFRSTTVGVNYDILNSLFGISFGRWFYNHCQVGGFGRTFFYTVAAQTNFKSDYGFAGTFSFRLPIRRIYRLSLNYAHKNLSRDTDFNFHNVGIRGYTFIRRPIGATLSVKPAFQSLNDKNNFGLIMGLQRDFWRHFGHRRFSTGLSVGYFNDYWTYSINAQYYLPQGFIPFIPRFRHFRLHVSYERIDRFDFFNVGLTYNLGLRRIR